MGHLSWQLVSTTLNNTPGGNPAANLKSIFFGNPWFLKSTPMQMPPESGGIRGICPWVASRVEYRGDGLSGVQPFAVRGAAGRGNRTGAGSSSSNSGGGGGGRREASRCNPSPSAVQQAGAIAPVPAAAAATAAAAAAAAGARPAGACRGNLESSMPGTSAAARRQPGGNGWQRWGLVERAVFDELERQARGEARRVKLVREGE